LQRVKVVEQYVFRFFRVQTVILTQKQSSLTAAVILTIYRLTQIDKSGKESTFF
jgi:hypothetical protein